MILCFHWLLIVHQVPGIVQCGRTTTVNKTGKSLVATYFMFVQAFGKQMGNKDTNKFLKNIISEWRDVKEMRIAVS